jgi:hypothetical protein
MIQRGPVSKMLCILNISQMMMMSDIFERNKCNDCHKPLDNHVINWLYGTFLPWQILNCLKRVVMQPGYSQPPTLKKKSNFERSGCNTYRSKYSSTRNVKLFSKNLTTREICIPNTCSIRHEDWDILHKIVMYESLPIVAKSGVKWEDKEQNHPNEKDESIIQ